MDADKRSDNNRAADREWTPLVGENVMVQCEGFRCMAYLDAEGKWRATYSNELLPKVIRVLSKSNF
jgi:hypothetical protein